jgi:hypothetical protein
MEQGRATMSNLPDVDMAADKCIPARRNAPLNEKELRYFERQQTTLAIDRILWIWKALSHTSSSSLSSRSLLWPKITLVWQCGRIFTSLDEGCISSWGWRFKRPSSACDRAEISFRLQMEAYVGLVNGLQPRIEASLGFRSRNLVFNGLVRYFLEVVDTVAYRRKLL